MATTTAAAAKSPIHRVTCVLLRGGRGPAASVPRGRVPCAYGVVVDNVNVSVLLYVPVRSDSLATICCRRPIVTGLALTGPV